MLMGIGIRLQAGARRQSRYRTYYWTNMRHHDDGEVSFFGGRLRDASPSSLGHAANRNLKSQSLSFFVPLLIARLLLRAPLFYQLLTLSTTDVSIAIQLLALSTRLLRRLLLRFFLPLILQFGLIPFLRFLHFAAAGPVSVTGASRQSCASLGQAASRFPLRVATSSGFTERLPTPPSPSSRHRLPMAPHRRIRSSQDLRKGVSMTSSDGSLRRRSHRAPSKPSSTR